MELTWQDIKRIVELYKHFEEDAYYNFMEWQRDEDQMGIKNPFDYSEEDLCKMTLNALKK